MGKSQNLFSGLVMSCLLFVAHPENVRSFNTTLQCYDCDSRYDHYCETIDYTKLTAPMPAIKQCIGSCLKFWWKLPDGNTFVLRSCSEDIRINHFMAEADQCVSLSEEKGKMCFCENTLCNKATSFTKSCYSLITLLTCAATVILARRVATCT